jgi:excisionase family DNA binding protein
MLQPTRDFYDVASLAEAFNLSERTIRELAASGQLPACKVGGKYLFSALALHELLGTRRLNVPYGEPSPEFKARIAKDIETLRPLLKRLAK